MPRAETIKAIRVMAQIPDTDSRNILPIIIHPVRCRHAS
jgi:hypothetical protein